LTPPFVVSKSISPLTSAIDMPPLCERNERPVRRGTEIW
jgi:hypothetical protein